MSPHRTSLESHKRSRLLETITIYILIKMAPGQEIALARDMTFENVMHKKTATTHKGFSAMLNKDKEAQRAAVAEYFQHWDNKEAKNETEADREVSTK